MQKEQYGIFTLRKAALEPSPRMGMDKRQNSFLFAEEFKYSKMHRHHARRKTYLECTTMQRRRWT